MIKMAFSASVLAPLGAAFAIEISAIFLLHPAAIRFTNTSIRSVSIEQHTLPSLFQCFGSWARRDTGIFLHGFWAWVRHPGFGENAVRLL
jgi:hypothetical protein